MLIDLFTCQVYCLYGVTSLSYFSDCVNLHICHLEKAPITLLSIQFGSTSGFF